MNTDPKWWHHLTGGRPMQFVASAFMDIVNGRDVNYYRDAFGRPWLAHGRWSKFRVAPTTHGPEIGDKPQ